MAAVDDADIELAHELATLATRAALPFVADAVAHETKPDGSPVSAADWAAEAAMLRHLQRYRPDDGVLSEESGQVASGRRRWLLDPIDGTVQFVSGGIEWGTHVALEVDGEMVLGIITRPLRAERWWAARGHGAFAENDDGPVARSRPLGVSHRATLGGARIGLYSMGDSEVPDRLGDAGATVERTGSHILELVDGRLDAVVAHRCGFIWDHAPAVVLAAEAGGRFSDPDGGTRADQQGGIYSNGHLHAALTDTLADRGIRLGHPPS